MADGFRIEIVRREVSAQSHVIAGMMLGGWRETEKLDGCRFAFERLNLAIAKKVMDQEVADIKPDMGLE